MASAAFHRFSKPEIEQSIADRFAQQVRRHPRRPAVEARDRRLDYAELDAFANRIANALLAERGEAEEPVALWLGQGASLVAAILGVLKAGKLYVALDPRLPEARVAAMLGDSGARVILTDPAHRKTCPPSACVLDVGGIERSAPAADPGRVLAPDRLAYLFYTSGSTGAPKGVVDNQRNVLHNVMRYTNSLEIGPEDRLTLLQSCSFSGSVSSLFGALMNGAAVLPFDLPAEGFTELAAWVRRERPSIFHSVPTIFRELLRSEGDFPSLRVIRLEGDTTRPLHVELFRERFGPCCTLVNGLGTTETGLIRQQFITPATKLHGPVVPVGQATEDMEVRLLEESGDEVDPGTVGEIAVRSRFLAVGYWRRPDLTRARFGTAGRDGCRTYRTGDLGRLRDDGALEHLGRRDFEVRVGGERVEVQRIEAALLEIDSVRDAVVAERESPSGRHRLVAYLVRDGEAALDADRLRRALRASLPDAAIPARFVTLEALPTDANGKIARGALPDPGRERPPLEVALAPSRHTLDDEIARCWSEVLEIESIGIHDDFLALGGDSLQALEIALRIEERLGTPLPGGVSSELPTVAETSDWIESRARSDRVVALQPEGSLVPFFCLHSYEGHVLDYRALARHLGPERPVFGLACGAPSRGPGLRLEDVARDGVRDLLEVWPRGPFLLGGNCFGGLLAFEVARQLVAHGREVGLLVLLDTAFPGREAAAPPLDRLRRGIHRARLARRLRRAARGAVPRRARDTVDAHRLAASRYRPRPFRGRAVLLCAGRPGNQRGWEDWVVAGLETVELPPVRPFESTHLTSEPHVQRVAEVLRLRLLEATGEFGSGRS